MIPILINKIARNARRWCLSQNNGISDGMCGDSVYYLQKRIIKLGYKTEFVCGWFDRQQHCWLEIEVNRQWFILDVTIDQFGKFPAVLWIPRKNKLKQYKKG